MGRKVMIIETGNFFSDGIDKIWVKILKKDEQL